MTTPPNKSDYLAYLHSFRGVAILSIIGAHAWSVLGFLSGAQEKNPDYIWLYASTETLFHGSTLFFALISGILFTRVLRNKSWKTFYLGKFKNVFSPYLFICLLLTALYWPEYLAYGKANGINFFFPEELAKNIVSGQAQTHLWYIPVLFMLFLLTPVVNALLKPGKGVAVILLALLPLLVSRSTYPDLLSLKTFVFFLGAYSFGIYLGERLEPMLAFIQRHLASIWLMFVASTLANFLLFFWDYVPTGFTSLHQSVVYTQKMLMALLLLYGLHAYDARLPKILNVLGTYAFSLYFLHFSFVWMLSEAFVKHFPAAGIPELFVAGLLIYVLSITLCLLLSKGLRKLFGKYSRMLIGT
ncbi:MAG TPA: acyltransferase [Arenimonas sp.]|nr:acyltransferase [Arenimonas sp.]